MEPGWKDVIRPVEGNSTDADVYAVNVVTGESTNLSPHQGKSLNLASSLSPDGKTLLITSDQKSGYQNVAMLDIATKKLAWITDTKWEANAGDFSPDGKSFTYTVNADGIEDVYIADRANVRAEKILSEFLFSLRGLPVADSRKLCAASRPLDRRPGISKDNATHPHCDC